MNKLTYGQKVLVYLVALIVIVVVATFVFHNTFAGIVVFAIMYFLYTRTIETHEGSSEIDEDSVVDVEEVTEEVIEEVTEEQIEDKNKED